MSATDVKHSHRKKDNVPGVRPALTLLLSSL